MLRFKVLNVIFLVMLVTSLLFGQVGQGLAQADNPPTATPTDQPTQVSPPADQPAPADVPTDQPAPPSVPTDQPTLASPPADQATPTSAPTDQPTLASPSADQTTPTDQPAPAASITAQGGGNTPHGHVTPAERQAAAARAAQARGEASLQAQALGETVTAQAAMNPGGVPDYFGNIPNWANSPIPASIGILGDGTGALAYPILTTGGAVADVVMTSGGSAYTDAGTLVQVYGGGGTGAVLNAVIDAGVIISINVVQGGSGYDTVPGIRKFVDSLPGLGAASANNLGQYIPVAVADTTTYSGSDYYEIALVQYTEQLHSDLPPTTLRGYVQVTEAPNAGKSTTLSCNGTTLYEMDDPHYLGPIIVAGSYDPNKPAGVSGNGKPSRIRFYNCLSTGAGGDLFIPVDPTIMGAGMGPKDSGGASCDPMLSTSCAMYSQNRATLHLHGGNTPWISDGTPHQWTTPATESTQYPKGVSVEYVPDMWFDPVTHATTDKITTPAAVNDPGDGSLTFYYTNQQSARLMFYHDHAYGITRLNVYSGEAAGYLVTDPVEQTLINGGTIGNVTVAAGTIPADEIPLVIQDKSFVPSESQLALQDPTWNWGITPGTVHTGDLWFPHVYMPNQNPFDIFGVNAMGRWDYGPWFWPPFINITNGQVPNPLYPSSTNPLEGPYNPWIPNPSLTPEAFMDTMMVNGTVYPYINLNRQPYRLRILNAGNDRSLNLQLYCAKSNGTMWNGSGALLDANAGEVNMVPALPNTGLPDSWPTDGRPGGVPDPNAAGPAWIQIGTEGGLMPAPAVVPNTPIGYTYNRKDITVLNIANHSLLLGPAERADVIVDFSTLPSSCSNVILYNDSPAPVPAFDPRIDYYTGDPDQTGSGGAPSTYPGYAPNTRTIMQIRLGGTPTAHYDITPLQTALPAAFAASQPSPIIPQADYNAAYQSFFPSDAYVRIEDNTMTYTPAITSLASVTVTNGGSAYTTPPVVSFTGGSGFGAAATATISGGVVTAVTLTNGGAGYTATGLPTVVFSGGGGSSAAATAVLGTNPIVAVNVTAGGSGYHAGTTTVNLLGGTGSGATATATVNGGGLVTGITVTNGGSGYTPTGLPTVVIIDSNAIPGTGATATATTAITIGLKPKAIQELFTTDYGRMNAILGVEIPNTTGINQTTIPFGYIDPTTEILQNTGPITPMGTLADGTQIWKITHNGVDTHAIHFHMFNVQLLNRVGWDGMVKPPEPNEIGWKETIRMNPLEDIIIATRPIIPVLPWPIPNSIRPFDVTEPVTATRSAIDPLNNAVTIHNDPINFGWEYVWHCHLLGHEENDMMRPMIIAVPPEPPTLSVSLSGGVNVKLDWVDNSLTAKYFILERADDPAFTVNLTTLYTGPLLTYTDPGVAAVLHYYRVKAAVDLGVNSGGSGPGGAFPTDTATSMPSNVQKYPPTLCYLTVDSPHGTIAPPVLVSYTCGVGTTVSLTATADAPLWTFANWTGDVPTPPNTANPVIVTMETDKTVIANYDPQFPTISGNAGVAGVTLSYTDTIPLTATSDILGNYALSVSPGWSGTITPTKTGYTFLPVSRTYPALFVDQPAQNYVATPITYTITGSTGTGGVTLSYTDGIAKMVNSNTSGNYTLTVSYNWSGTITPSKTGYTFSPANRVYTNVLANQTAQNYVATQIAFTISGSAGVAFAILSYTDGTPKTITADVNGNYTLLVSYDWSGTVTPSFTGYVFAPSGRTYSHILANQTGQNYTTSAAFNLISPAINAKLLKRRVTLVWQALTGAGRYIAFYSYDGVHFRRACTVTRTSCSITVTNFRTVYWRVLAYTRRRAFLASSPTHYFKSPYPPSRPRTIAPVNNAKGTAQPTFSWAASTPAYAADHYFLSIQGYGVITVPGSQTFYTIPAGSPLFVGSSYRWKVRACNDVNLCSSWSAIKKYIVTTP